MTFIITELEKRHTTDLNSVCFEKATVDEIECEL